MTAIDYPSVTLRNGDTYRLRFSLLATKNLKSMGIDVFGKTDTAEQAWQQVTCGIAATAYKPRTDGDETKLVPAGLTSDSVDAIYESDPDISELAALQEGLRSALVFRMAAGTENSQSAPPQK